MNWIIEITVTGFLLGEAVLHFNGFWKEPFASFEICAAFLKSDVMKHEEQGLVKIARAHLRDNSANVVMESVCKPAPSNDVPV